MIFTDKTLIEMIERRPGTLDQMAGVSGVGAKKLESYGPAFLAVLNDERAEPVHPQRRRLAGTGAADVFDRLAEAQRALGRGDGTEKPLSLTASALRRIAQARPRTLRDLDAVGHLGPQKLDRFGAAFLEILDERRSG